MIEKKPAADSKHVLVTFCFRGAPWSRRVNLVGSFNNWMTSETPMEQDPDDLTWAVTLKLDAGREYEFRYLIDGTEWRNEWYADTYVPNAFGSENSVIVL
jgi:1,4-alpha-glucan branching enzyme